jgi:hypothetical protein
MPSTKGKSSTDAAKSRKNEDVDKRWVVDSYSSAAGLDFEQQSGDSVTAWPSEPSAEDKQIVCESS